MTNLCLCRSAKRGTKSGTQGLVVGQRLVTLTDHIHLVGFNCRQFTNAISNYNLTMSNISIPVCCVHSTEA